MMIDTLKNLQNYLHEEDKAAVLKFLENVNPDMAEGLYAIEGQRIYAKVMSYRTSPKEVCRIEAHNRYIDIQATLQGVEGIDIFHRNELEEETAYDPEEDATFFKAGKSKSYISVHNYWGTFSMIFPHEAHKPQIAATGLPALVKKFVIKLEAKNYIKDGIDKHE